MLKKKVFTTLMIATLLTLASCAASGNSSSSSSSSQDSIIPSESTSTEAPSTSESIIPPTSDTSISIPESSEVPFTSDTPTSEAPSTPEFSEPESSETPSTPSVHVHEYGEWVYDKQATEFEEGLRHKTCECGDKITEVVPYALDFPRVHIDYKDFHPSAPDIDKGFDKWTYNYIDVPIRYEPASYSLPTTFDCVAKLKMQGSSSKNGSYLKKNFTIKLYQDRECLIKNDVEMVPGWGAQNKYVLKANWIDYTSARNLVAADLWSEIVDSRSTSNYVTARNHIEQMIHNGAVDGFPVMLYFNGEYFGLYTFNIPKDNWLFGMKHSPNEALLFAEGTARKPNGSIYQSTSFRETINWNTKKNEGSGWELEYAYDETDTQWIADSMNKAISVVMNTYGKINTAMSANEKRQLRDKFIREAPIYLDIDGCIDYMIFLHCIQGFSDNSTRNLIWSTYDGKTWSLNAYDLDTIWGMQWDGEMYLFEDRPINETTGGFWLKDWYRANLRGNSLFEALLLFCPEKLQSRYNELRADNAPLSNANIENKLSLFINSIPSILYQREKNDFPSRPSERPNRVTGGDNSTDLNQLVTYSNKILAFMDEEYNGYKIDFNKNFFN